MEVIQGLVRGLDVIHLMTDPLTVTGGGEEHLAEFLNLDVERVGRLANLARLELH